MDIPLPHKGKPYLVEKELIELVGRFKAGNRHTLQPAEKDRVNSCPVNEYTILIGQ
jgi:hypothetical protein